MTFLLLFGYPRDDISGMIQTVPGIQNFDVSIGLCKPLERARMSQTCGQHTPIEVIESDTWLTTPMPERPDRCWDIGQITDVSPILVEHSNPQAGVALDFGQTLCCSANLTATDVSVLLKPNDCHKNSITAAVTAGNLEILADCSNTNKSLQIEVQTSVLCDTNIEWRLSVRDTTVHCNHSESDELYCKIKLKTRNATVQSQPSMYCKHTLKLWIVYANGSEVNATVEYANDSHDVCTFGLKSQDVCKLSVVYTYASASPQVIKINGQNEYTVETCNTTPTKTIIAITLTTIGVVVFLLLGVLVLVIRRRTKASKKVLGHNKTSDNNSADFDSVVQLNGEVNNNESNCNQPQCCVTLDNDEPQFLTTNASSRPKENTSLLHVEFSGSYSKDYGITSTHVTTGNKSNTQDTRDDAVQVSVSAGVGFSKSMVKEPNESKSVSSMV